MSGKALLILVVGMIFSVGTILYNIEASSTRVVKNFSDYYTRQGNQNLAQVGVNLAMRRLGEDRAWREGFSDKTIGDGIVNVEVIDTWFDSIKSIRIRSIAETDYGVGNARFDTSTAWAFYTRTKYPVAVRGLINVNGATGINGNITLDGRNHDIEGKLIPGTGVPGIWSSAAAFDQPAGAGKIGGTVSGVDYAPSNPAAPQIKALSQTTPEGYPQTPDQVFGNVDSTFPEGTLKAIAKNGFGGSQYVTDPSKLRYPLSGVTYVETPTTSPGNVWNAGKITGEGILIVHNPATNAMFNNADGEFTGLVIADDVAHLHGVIIGGVISFTTTMEGNVIGNGNASILYSRDALETASKWLEIGTQPSIFAWWE